MTIFETWKLNGTKHSPFVLALFECYMLASPEDQMKLNRAYPGFFITQRTDKRELV